MSDSLLPGPTAEHKALESMVGTWNAQCSFHMGGPEPMKVEATETVQMFGQYFTEGLFEANMFGMPFQGRSSMGYEPSSGEYVSTWWDTMTPQLFAFRGKFDDAGKVLTMHAKGTDFMSGQPASYRTTEEHDGPDKRTFCMFMQVDGQPEVQLFTHEYTRA